MSDCIKENRLAAFKKQAGKCYYCSYPMWLINPEGFSNKHKITLAQAKMFQCTAEHLTARCDGGKDNKKNIVAACLYCNNTRHLSSNPLTPSKYKERVKKQIRKKKWNSKVIPAYQAPIS